ncbi:MAG: M48 family metalloprotease [Armatimonadota bacterium]|nr:MAG: M48 family metalloprotease [Armatimonadota bacterium]
MWVHATTAASFLLLLTCFPAFSASPEAPVSQAEATPASVKMTPEEKADAEIGKRAAEEVKKQFKIIEDSPEVPRIAAIVERLRPATEKPHQTYHVHVIETSALNSFAIPGGYLYYTQGLLEAVESEDELAAVTAHEMAHICLSHSRRLMSKDERYEKILGPLVLISILSNSEALDPGKIALIGAHIVQDALNHYGREAELEADHAAVIYLKSSQRYHPVAVLTVLEGLARLESGRPQVEMGVFQTHPRSRERVEAVRKSLEELSIPIERRRVTLSLVAEAGPVTQDDVDIGELRLNGRVIFQPAAELNGLSPLSRAERSAEMLNALLLANLQLLEVGVVEGDHEARLEARGETILTITEADASFHSSTAEALVQKAMNAIRLGFQEERVRRAY